MSFAKRLSLDLADDESTYYDSVPSCNRPLPEPMLTQCHVVIWHYWAMSPMVRFWMNWIELIRQWVRCISGKTIYFDSSIHGFGITHQSTKLSWHSQIGHVVTYHCRIALIFDTRVDSSVACVTVLADGLACRGTALCLTTVLLKRLSYNVILSLSIHHCLNTMSCYFPTCFNHICTILLRTIAEKMVFYAYPSNLVISCTYPADWGC